MNNINEEIKRILHLMGNKDIKLNEDFSNSKKEIIKDIKPNNLINEGWEKYPCVAKHAKAIPVKLKDGSIGYSINSSDGSGEAVYYNNGRYYQYGKYSNYSCNDAFWQTVTKHYNKLGKGDYSTKTWGGQPLQSIVGKTLPDGAYTGQGRHTGGEYFKNPLNDGYDYMFMPGLAFADNQPRWVLMPMSLRNERWPSLGSQTIDQFIANSPQWYTRKNAVKAIYDAWMSEKVTTKDPIVGEITPLSEDSWSPLAIGMLRKHLAVLGYGGSKNVDPKLKKDVDNVCTAIVEKYPELKDESKLEEWLLEYFARKYGDLFLFDLCEEFNIARD
jgi:hypothetical protein